MVASLRLHNLKDDIGEKTDLAAQHPEKVKALKAAWPRLEQGTARAGLAAAAAEEEEIGAEPILPTENKITLVNQGEAS